MNELFQSYIPETPKEKKRLFTPVPLRLIAPNAITLFGLCLGLTAIRFSYDGRLEPAVWAIIAAAVLDGLDGRVARLFKGTSRFGVELDSLADAINFGVAPALVLYNFTLHNIGAFGWVVSLIYAIALCLRLARFNVMAVDPSRPDWKKGFFTGIPAPACALTSLLPLYLHLLSIPMDSVYAAIPTAFYVLCIALLAVSNIPIYSGKTMSKRIPSQWVLPILLAAAACFTLMITYKLQALAFIAMAYLILIPLSVSHYQKLEKRYDAEKKEDDETNIAVSG